MILLWLWACAEPDPPFTPALGAWTVEVAAKWDGDCELEDRHTYEAPEQDWILDDYRYGFAVRDEHGYWYPCTLDDRAFVCDRPVIADDFRDFGLDVQATYTPAWRGEFIDASTFSGALQLDATCDGADCDQLTGYGPDFTFPCVAKARIQGSAQSE